MNPFERAASISPLPIVDLTCELEPQDGIINPLSETCRKNLRERREACMRHYRAVAASPAGASTIFQCPFGFSTIVFKAGGMHAAMTGFVPVPRQGGAPEKIVANRHREARVPVEGIRRAILGIVNAHARFQEIEQSVIEKYSMALHEIRKLNRNVKQNAERLCRQESPNDLEKARKELVTILKSSEMMSAEFDVIEVLANANQVELPLDFTAEPYRLFDKFVKIYRSQLTGSRQLQMKAEEGYRPRIAACEKTLHILPSVFIENAMKYSAPGTVIRVSIESDPNDGKSCVVSVESEAEGQQILDDRVFLKGYRAATGRQEGSGTGLYVAQLIAKQHNTAITVQSQPNGPTRVRHTFRVKFRTL
jgi:light-regulated signal transduction histidine kinase (bacteriophytochrome)